MCFGITTLTFLDPLIKSLQLLKQPFSVSPLELPEVSMTYSLSYEQLLSLWEEIRPLLLHSFIRSFRELSPGQWILECCQKEKTYSLLLCIHPPLVRFHLVSKKQNTYNSPFLLTLKSTFKDLN